MASKPGSLIATVPLRVRSSSTTCDEALALRIAWRATYVCVRGMPTFSISQLASTRSNRSGQRLAMSEGNTHPQAWKHRKCEIARRVGVSVESYK